MTKDSRLTAKSYNQIPQCLKYRQYIAFNRAEFSFILNITFVACVTCLHHKMAVSYNKRSSDLTQVNIQQI